MTSIPRPFLHGDRDHAWLAISRDHPRFAMGLCNTIEHGIIATRGSASRFSALSETGDKELALPRTNDVPTLGAGKVNSLRGAAIAPNAIARSYRSSFRRLS